MSVPYHYAKRFVGQPVVAHCAGGRRYYGVVRSVTPECVVIQQFAPGVVPVEGKSKKMKIDTADKPGKAEMEDVQFYGYGFGSPYAFGARIALPLYVLLALSLFWI